MTISEAFLSIPALPYFPMILGRPPRRPFFSVEPVDPPEVILVLSPPSILVRW